ncbi:MAG: pyruvate carboxylase [Actinomycetota bacterium]|nr:pyruvate carboxylase [Actinomycetota bacterium]
MRKLLIANRGEIAIRAARAARELGLGSVAIYAAEDRSALHRLIADEAYQIGEAGHPVRSYLDIPRIIELAHAAGADAVYPGYGFLSESAAFAQAVIDAGLTWVGPTPATLVLTGDKVRGRDSAVRAGVPVLGASGPVASLDEALREAERIGYPVFIKASGGGGGRGLRRVDTAAEATDVFDGARREAAAAFGDDTLFVEQAVIRPRHVEVQVLADASGNVVHLFERDCSVQRRHQKVVEIAPAPGLPHDLVARLCQDAVRFAREVEYSAAGTVEFLVWRDPDSLAQGHESGFGYAFIEMNPRIQVEHTVTEEVTGIDLVLAQLRIARGESLADLGIAQERIVVQRSAIQCRLTTEDPADGFRPATGTIVEYRSPGGPGVRLDGATYAGADVTPFYDSLLVKLTTSGADFASAAQRARRALSEFQVRGVATNVSFLRALLSEPDFLSGDLTTAFLDEHPGLLSAQPGAGLGSGLGAASGLLVRLAEVTVNRPHGEPRFAARDPAALLPGDRAPATRPALTAKQVLDDSGPQALAEWLRHLPHVAVTDTTLRDAHQSLLATRVRTIDLVTGARAQAGLLPGLFSMECWGGATFDAALRFLGDDPWERLAALRAAAPDVLTQMLIRGRNALGYAPYPDDVVSAFVAEARHAGMDVFRVFDALNGVDRTRPVIDAVREHGGYAEGAICYTADVLDPDEPTYTLDYYLRIADEYVAAGVHGLVIKDMAGLLRAPAGAALVTALRSRFDVPVRLHTHDTAGGQLGTYLAAIEAGVDGVDCAAGPLASGGSQPSLGALLAATLHTPRDPGQGGGLELDDAARLEPYWYAVRDLYAPFEAGQRSPATSVYRHEVPGGQLSNLKAQADALGVGDRFSALLDAYHDAALLLGRPVKVTPSSKVVGDLAVWMVAAGVTAEALRAEPARHDLPASVIAYLQGQLGVPAGGFVEPFTSEVLAGKPPLDDLVIDAADRAALAEPSARREALTRLMLPAEARAFDEARSTYGDVSVLPTCAYLYGLQAGITEVVTLAPGQQVFVELDAIGELDESGRRSVHLRANGQPIALRVVDERAPRTTAVRPKADPADPRHLAASVPGVVTVLVKVGDPVRPGDRVAVIEAMKMESSVTAGVGGVVGAVHVADTSQVEPGDLVVTIKEDS